MPIYIILIQAEKIFAYKEKYGLEGNNDHEKIKENFTSHTRRVRNADVSDICQPVPKASFHAQAVSLLRFLKQKNAVLNKCFTIVKWNVTII